MSYFASHPDADKRGRVKCIKDQLCNEVKLYMLFLNFLLLTVNAFNVAFQATSHTTIHLLYTEIIKLTKRALQYFVTVGQINITDVTATKYENHENQLTDDELEVGDNTRHLAPVMTEDGMEHIVSAFFCKNMSVFSTVHLSKC